MWRVSFSALTMRWSSLSHSGWLSLPVPVNALLMPGVFGAVFIFMEGEGKYRVLFHYLTATMAGIMATPILAAMRRSFG